MNHYASTQHSPSLQPCGLTIYLPPPKQYGRVVCRQNPTDPLKQCSTIDGRLFYLFGVDGVRIVDSFCNSFVFVPYHLRHIVRENLVQISSDTLIYYDKKKVQKIHVDFDRYSMHTIDEHAFDHPIKTVERIADDRYIVAHHYLELFHSDDIHNSFQVFRIDSTLHFCLFNYHEEKLYFFSRNATSIDLCTLHIIDPITGRKQICSTSKLPSFYYTPPVNSNTTQQIIIKGVYWVDDQLFLWIQETENYIPFYHLIILDIPTLQWRLIANTNIEIKPTVLVDQNGVISLIDFRVENRVQIYDFYRIPLKQPETLKNLAQFALMRQFPLLYQVPAEYRAWAGFPATLPFHPFFSHEFCGTLSTVRSLKQRIANSVRVFFGQQRKH